MKTFSALKFAFYRYGEDVKTFFRHIAPKCNSSMVEAISEMFNDYIQILPKEIEDRIFALECIVIRATIHGSYVYDYGKQYDIHTFNVTICSRQEMSSFICLLKDMLHDNTYLEIEKFIYYEEGKIFIPHVEQECGYTIIELDRNPV